MVSKDFFSAAAASAHPRSLPVLSFPGAFLLGTDVKGMLSSPENQAAGMAAVAKRCPTLAAVSMMDLSVEAEAFGSRAVFFPDEVPSIVGSLVTNEEEAKALAVPPVGAGRTGRNVETIALAKKLITDRPVFAGCIGPFSLAGRLIGVSEMLVTCYEEEDTVTTVLEKATEFIIRYIEAFRAAGADGIVMAEPLTGVISPSMAEVFSIPYVMQIISACQREDFPIVYHNCGASVSRMTGALLEQGAAAYHFGNACDLDTILAEFPEDTVVMGNLDPSSVLRNGTPESVREATLALLEKYSSHKNWLISSGCDIPPATPWENLDAYFAAIDEFYESR